MDPVTVVMVLAFIVFFGTVMFSIAHRAAIFTKGCSFDDYIRAFPDAVKAGGVKCCKCGGGIYVRKAGIGFGEILQSHICNQCGVELYRSKRPIN